VAKIDGKLGDIAARMDKLETPSEDEKSALDSKMDKVQESM